MAPILRLRKWINIWQQKWGSSFGKRNKKMEVRNTEREVVGPSQVAIAPSLLLERNRIFIQARWVHPFLKISRHCQNQVCFPIVPSLVFPYFISFLSATSFAQHHHWERLCHDISWNVTQCKNAHMYVLCSGSLWYYGTEMLLVDRLTARSWLST